MTDAGFVYLDNGEAAGIGWSGVRVFVDMETGVQYLGDAQKGGMCLRVDQWGKPMALTQDQLADLKRKGMRQTTQYI